MAARLFRTLAADEVVSDGGAKLGMLGTGGRTYRNYSRGREPVCCRCYFLTRVIALLLLVWAVVMAIVSESSLSAVTHCADRASREATSLSTSAIGGSPVQQANDLARGFEGRLVHLQSANPVVLSPLIHDDFFSVMFHRDVAIAERVVEFCQWQEIQHVSRVLVGRDPGCPEGERGENCNIYRTDVSFSYVKGWHSSLISSAFFDNPVAYHNPQRMPCASIPLQSPRVEGGESLGGRVCLARVADDKCIHADGRAMEHGLLPVEHMQLDGSTFDRRSASQAAAQGFTEWDRSFVYSRQAAFSSFGTDLAHAALSYFVDGVVGFEGPSSLFCTPGDVRVHFAVRRLSPNGVSLVGQLADNFAIEPFACDESSTSSTRLMLAYPKANLALEDLLAAVLHDAKTSAWWYRLGSALLTGAALLLVYFSCKPRGESFLSD